MEKETRPQAGPQHNKRALARFHDKRNDHWKSGKLYRGSAILHPTPKKESKARKAGGGPVTPQQRRSGVGGPPNKTHVQGPCTSNHAQKVTEKREKGITVKGALQAKRFNLKKNEWKTTCLGGCNDSGRPNG